MNYFRNEKTDERKNANKTKKLKHGGDATQSDEQMSRPFPRKKDQDFELNHDHWYCLLYTSRCV